MKIVKKMINGRVVIPKSYRELLGIKLNDKVEMLNKGRKVILKKIDKQVDNDTVNKK